VLGSWCNDCWCVPDEGKECPSWRPANLTQQTIDAFKKQTLTNPMDLPCDPYEDENCKTVPPQTGNDKSVCVATYSDDSCGSYKLTTMTHEAFDLLPSSRSIVTHTGACGVCSTMQDLAVYASIFDMTSAGKKCGVKTMISESWGTSCFEDLGFTTPCAKIWMLDAKYDTKGCKWICIKQLFKAYNLPPDCRLNECLQCDEDVAGPLFKKFAGRTRRRSGLESAIARPCASVAEIQHNPCPSDLPMQESDPLESSKIELR